MNEKKKSRIITMITGFVICLLIGAGLMFAVLNNYGYADAEIDSERYRILCDACTIPGLTLMLCAGLAAVYNHGAFTGVSYGLRRTRDILLPFLRTEYVKYPDYKRKKEKKKIQHYAFLLYAGLVFTLPAVYFMIRFYQVR